MSRRDRWRVVGVLAALVAVLALQRIHTYAEPLERDIHTYALIGHEMLGGRRLYSDLWDIKPPAVYATYAAAELAVGFGRPSVFLLNLLAAVATLLAVWRAGGALGLSRAAGLWAAAVWTVLSADMLLQANQPNTEVFLNACQAWAFALLVLETGPRGRWRRVIGAGVLFALASLFKPVAAVMAGAVGCLLIARPGPADSSRRAALGRVAAMAAVGVAVWALVFGYFAATGRWTISVDTVFRYGASYAKNPAMSLLKGLWPQNLAPRAALFLVPLGGVVLAAGVAAARRGGAGRPWALLAAYAAGTWASICAPGLFHMHYYQLWLAPLAIGAGWAATVFGAGSRRRPHFWGAALVALLLLYELPNYRLTPEDWSRRKYDRHREVYWQTSLIAERIEGWLDDGETFFEWGDDPGLYFETRRPLVSGIFWSHHMLFGAQAPERWKRAAAQLEDDLPEMLIVSMPANVAAPPDHPSRAWIENHYELFPHGPCYGDFIFHARKGGALEARLNAAGAPFSLVPAQGAAPDGIALANGEVLPVVSGKVQGSVDSVVLDPDGARIQGWAAETDLGRPAESVLLFRDGQFVWRGACGLERPDVAEGRDDPRLLRSGFLISLPEEGWRKVDASALRIFALGWEGSVSELPVPQPSQPSD